MPYRVLLTIITLLSALVVGARAPLGAQEPTTGARTSESAADDPAPLPDELRYPRGVEFPRPTSAALDTLLLQGIVPKPLDAGVLRPMYWARSAFIVAARATFTPFMTQALEGGYGFEGNVALPLGPTDYGAHAFVRSNRMRVVQRGWLGWTSATGEEGIVVSAGLGASFAVPLRHPQFSIPGSISLGGALFQTTGGTGGEAYLMVEPSLGVRYRVLPAFAIMARINPSYMIATSEQNRSVGAWGFSLGVEVSPALRPRQPLQFWAPPLVVNAQDVVKLLTHEMINPLNVLDRNLDFINTELKPLTAFGWYDLGFYGEVRGTVMASSRASSGNVTALDIRIDSADRRGFRVTRTASMVNPALAERHRATSVLPRDSAAIRGDSAVMARISSGDYAYRPDSDLGVRYLRVEVFPQAKGPLELVPKTGSRVVIRGDIRWDGDGHMELHPRKSGDIRIVVGEFLDSDDPIGLE